LVKKPNTYTPPRPENGFQQHLPTLEKLRA
jgi:hypothetical protein